MNKKFWNELIRSRSDNDLYNKKIGVKIALGRALFTGNN